MGDIVARARAETAGIDIRPMLYRPIAATRYTHNPGSILSETVRATVFICDRKQHKWSKQLATTTHVFTISWPSDFIITYS